MAEQTPNLKRRIRRAVILTDGSAAEAVAEALEAFSRAWLGTEPPLAVVRNVIQENASAPGDCKSLQPWQSLPPQADRELPQGDSAQVAAVSTAEHRPAFTLNALCQACDCLTSGEASGRLRAAGYTLARPDEIQLWVMAHVTGDAASPPDRLDELPNLLAMFADAVWQRTRIHVTTRGLLLAEPATEALAANWARRLVDAGAEQVFIAGPVDAAHLRWEPGVWQARAATALAALLWSEVALPNPSGLARHEALTEDGDAIGAWSIGAAAWQALLAQIRRHVVIRGAMRLVERLIGKDQPFEVSEPSRVLRSDDLPPWEMSGLAVAPERHRLILESAVPLEPPAQVWGGQRPDWHTLLKLPAALRATAEKRAAQAHDVQYTPRGEWLGGQVAAWNTALEQLRRERLVPVTGWPRVRLYYGELEALAAALQAACVTIEDWLEEAGQRFEGAAAGASQALQALEALCAGFPAPTRAAAWATLLQPWRWLEVAWAYWIMLPRYAQKYLDAAYHQGRARWLEANTHALRQAYLAMAQVTHDQQDEIGKLFAALTQAQVELAEQLKGFGAPPEPWDEMELQRLAGSLLPEAWPTAWALHVPDTSQVPGTWSSTSLNWVADRLGELADWTAADCLANTLDDAGLLQRLDSLAEAALPLWPGTEQEADAALWLIWPSRKEELGQHSAEERLQAALHAWAGLRVGARLHMHAAEGSADALLVLRTTAVTLNGQKQEVI